jgi:hypothetical protein
MSGIIKTQNQAPIYVTTIYIDDDLQFGVGGWWCKKKL